MKLNNTQKSFDEGWGRAVLEEAVDRGVMAAFPANWCATDGGLAARVDAGIVNQAWAGLLARASRPLEPVLAVRKRLRTQDLGPLGIAIACAPNWRSAVALSERYLPLMSDVLQVDYITEGGTLLARLRNNADAFWPNQLLFFLHRMELVEQLLRRRPPIMALLLNFADPGLKEELSGLIDAPVIFEAAYSGVVISADPLDRDAPGAQPQIHQAMVDVLEAELEQAGGRTFLRVCEVVRQSLESGTPVSAKSVASRLHISARTLQRRLQEEGTTFAEVVRYKRLRTAQRMLLTSEATVQEIADRLGFANQHGFSRFFQAVTGTSPSQFRKRQGATIKASELIGMARITHLL